MIKGTHPLIWPTGILIGQDIPNTITLDPLPVVNPQVSAGTPVPMDGR